MTTKVRLPGQPDQPPLSFYIHFPWCEKKCPYCDFNSHESTSSELPEQRYLDALRRDLESWAPKVYGRKIESIFIGGGTPSLISPNIMDQLLSDVKMLLDVAPAAEITMEANPGSAEAGRYKEYAACGINRLSIGVQSFNDNFLAAIGRVHDAQQAHYAVTSAMDTFERVNIDLMYALPNQDAKAACEDIKIAASYKPEHISSYHLTIEAGTEFAVKPPQGLPDSNTAADIDDEVHEELQSHGYSRYEISAFCQKFGESKHNLNYWRYGDYLAIGAGAHAKITDGNGVVREMRHKAPERYMAMCEKNESIAFSERVKNSDLPFEFMLNALRLVDGFDEKMYFERTGLPLTSIGKLLDDATKRDLIYRDGKRITPTKRGLEMHNDLCGLFLSQKQKIISIN